MKIEKVNIESISKAAEIIKKGGLVAFPTETVYGLGADALNPEAVAKIYESKGRPPDNPLILHVNGAEGAAAFAREINEAAGKIIMKFWPGPVTLVFKKKDSLPEWVGGHPANKMTTVAMRSPEHIAARKLIDSSGCAIAAPSANKAGRPSPTSAGHVAKDFTDDDVFILDGGETFVGLESTVVDVTESIPRILRPGLITEEMIMSVVNSGLLKEKPDTDENISSVPISPGMKYKHYAPNARMTLVCGDIADISKYIINEIKESDGGIFATKQTEAHPGMLAAARTETRFGILATAQTENVYREAFGASGNIYVVSLGDRRRPEEIARRLYACLREFNELNVDEIYAEGVEDAGIGRAIMNRLRKSCGGRITELS